MKMQGGIEATQRTKYYDQRYRLFSLYDYGIKLDEESWFSVTPEIISTNIAEFCLKCSQLNQQPLHIILDCFRYCFISFSFYSLKLFVIVALEGMQYN